MKFLKSILGVLSGGMRALYRYPASMLCAVTVAVLATISIAYNQNDMLINSLQLVFVFGTFFNMAVAAGLQKLKANFIFDLIINAVGILITILVFILVYFPSQYISEINTARLIIFSFLSVIAFILIASAKTDKFDFNKMLFMFHKSLIIAAVYTLVIMLGLFFVVFAFKSLIYSELSEDIYSYIAIYSVLLGYAFFLGYFPSFKNDEDDEAILRATKYPRFIEVLLQYILIPILAVLSLVLFIWTVKIVISNELPPFEQLSGIFTGYSLFGIWLYIMISPYTNRITVIYRRVFPIATLVFLAFEGYAIIQQIINNSITDAEYIISLIWIFTVLSSIAFIIFPVRKNRLTGYIAIIILALSVMPILGFIDFPVSVQVRRLEAVLIRNNMFKDNKIVKATNISEKDKTVISESVHYLAGAESTRMPKWLDNKEEYLYNFKEVFGFEQTNDNYPDYYNEETLYMTLEASYFNSSQYQYFISDNNYNSNISVNLEGNLNTYTVSYNNSNEKPELIVMSDSTNILSINLGEYLNDLYSKYRNENYKSETYPIEVMSVKEETDGLKIMVVFNSITIRKDLNTNNMIYETDLNGIFLGE